MTAPTSQPARVVSRMGEVGKLRGGDESEGIAMFFSTKGNISDTDSAVAEPTAAEVAPHSHGVPAGAGQAGDGTTGEALAGVDRGVWRATAGHSHCAVTGAWLEARDEAARLLGAPVSAVAMRRIK